VEGGKEGGGWGCVSVGIGRCEMVGNGTAMLLDPDTGRCEHTCCN